MNHQGKFVNAEAIVREVIAMQCRVLGPGYPDTLTSGMNLAATLDSQGKFADAEAMLAVQSHVRGPEHPETLRSGVNLATTLSAQDKHTDAETILREVLAVLCRILGPEHP